MRSDTTTNPHEQFEKLAALELIGELSAQEHRELQMHLKSCESCRQEYRGFEDVLSRKLPLLHPEQSAIPEPRKHGVLKELATLRNVLRSAGQLQFLPRADGDLAAKKSFPLNSQAVAFSSSSLAAILVITLAVFSFQMRQQSKEAQRQVAAFKDRVSVLSTELQNRPRVVVNEPEKQPSESVPQREDQSARLIQRTRDLERELNISAKTITLLKDQLQSTETSDKALVQRASGAQEQLERASADLQAALNDRDQASINLKDKETELLALEQEATALRDSVDRDHALLAASHDITNLMGARNLRIIDVSDVDGRGKTRKAFGRVFFTEGKSLVFYAFDLPDGRSNAHPASFQAWGAQGANLPSAKSLGIFFHDDHTSNRWILKFDDPIVLSEIDSVFVTVEPLGGSKKPTGTPLLPAYLKAELNHP